MFLTLPAEVVRIAYAFQAAARRPTPEGSGLLTAAHYILAQPDGEDGCHVFSCDGSAVCVQFVPAMGRSKSSNCGDPCIVNVVPEVSKYLTEGAANRWIVHLENRVAVYDNFSAADQRTLVTDRTILTRAHIHQNVGACGPAPMYPDWKSLISRSMDNENWIDGIPSEGLSLRHFAIIGGLWREWPDVRSVEVKHSGEGSIAVRFPSRPDMLIFIAKDAPFCQPVEEEDPAAGL